MSGHSFPEAPVDWSDANEHRRILADVVNNAMHGKTNNTGTVTLAANAATTTITDRNIGTNSVLLLIPTTADAAAAMATTYQTFPNTTKNQAVLNHANNAQADKTFAYVVVG